MKYEDREQFYKFLIDEWGFRVIEEKYDPKAFGNFYVILAGRDTLFMYVKDRSILGINVSKDIAEPEWYDIPLVKSWLYDEKTFNIVSIEEQNHFVKKEMDKITELFNNTNYPNTQKSLIETGKLRFKARILNQ